MPHMPATGVSGLDLYVKADDGRWRWLGVGQPVEKTNTTTLVSGLPAGRHVFLLYLPLYNGVSSVELGVPEGGVIEKPARRTEGRLEADRLLREPRSRKEAAPSRPGAIHTAILGRRFDRPVINLGFSGNGRMEPEMAAPLAELDPAVYVLDCLPNMSAAEADRASGAVRPDLA